MFLTQLLKESSREGSLLDLLFLNREGLVGDVVVNSSKRHESFQLFLGHSSYEMRVFSY